MASFSVHTSADKQWLPADKVVGIPECLTCKTPLLMISGGNIAYAFCLTCRVYYLAMPKEAPIAPANE